MQPDDTVLDLQLTSTAKQKRNAATVKQLLDRTVKEDTERIRGPSGEEAWCRERALLGARTGWPVEAHLAPSEDLE